MSTDKSTELLSQVIDRNTIPTKYMLPGTSTFNNILALSDRDAKRSSLYPIWSQAEVKKSKEKKER